MATGANGAINQMKDDSFKRMLKAVTAARNETLKTLSGNRSGRTYKVPGTQRTYTASAPGEPPAQATGEARQHVSTAVEVKNRQVIGYIGIKQSAKNKVTGVSIGEYMLCQEYGTKKMEPRPWLKPSCEKAEPEIKRILGGK